MKTKSSTICMMVAILLMIARQAYGNFVIPYECTLFLKPMGGEAHPDGFTIFGLGTSYDNFIQIFAGQDIDLKPNYEIAIGNFNTGDIVYFAMYSEFWSESAWAFSNDTVNPPSVTAFTDIDNSLGFGGKVIEQTGPETWLMHLDNAMSYKYDDDDNDILMQIRIIPEPASALLIGLGCLFAGLRKRQR
jgi:hypothetical protein